MKYITLILSLTFALNSQANIEYMPDETTAPPTEQEISKNRACFQELTTQGCGDPGDDAEHFRSCMSNVYPTLSKDCQALMSELYGK